MFNSFRHWIRCEDEANALNNDWIDSRNDWQDSHGDVEDDVLTLAMHDYTEGVKDISTEAAARGILAGGIIALVGAGIGLGAICLVQCICDKIEEYKCKKYLKKFEEERKEENE